MVVDADLTARLRDALGDRSGLSVKRMFGGECVMLDGNMVCGAHRDKTTGDGRFMFRVGKDNVATASALSGAEPMIHGGRKMGGFFYVSEADASNAALSDWASLALSHAESLPPKDGP